MRTTLIFVLAAGTAFVAGAADQPPRMSPAFTIHQTGGAPEIPLSQYRGKIVALAFIQTTCPHCQDLTRTLKPIAQEYTPRGVQFLECAFNEGAATLVPQFVQQFQPPFPVGWADNVAVRVYLQYAFYDTRVLYVPHMVFLDRRGMIRGDFAGESSFFTDPNTNIRAELEKLLKPAGPGTRKK
ncbi:MAG TPA: TlpA disulfide reductase family protein [Bryobacteraceae bacterium]|nr:TlpA disulfide reductase family protein [Bryobacteraceae bacterium]